MPTQKVTAMQNKLPKPKALERVSANIIMSKKILEMTADMPCLKIEKNGQPYLNRYFVCEYQDGSQDVIHNIIAADPEPLWHSHPWTAHSQILKGGYTEERFYNGPDEPFFMKYELIEGDTNFITPDTLHRITRVQPNTWTYLHISAHRAKQWFFIDEKLNKKVMQASEHNWWHGLKTRDGLEPVYSK